MLSDTKRHSRDPSVIVGSVVLIGSLFSNVSFAQTSSLPTCTVSLSPGTLETARAAVGLSWKSSGATSGSIVGLTQSEFLTGTSTIASSELASGSRIITPNAEKTIQISVINAQGSGSCSATVRISPTPQPPSFTVPPAPASPPTITSITNAPGPSVTIVSSPTELSTALQTAEAGDVFRIKNGTYTSWSSTVSTVVDNIRIEPETLGGVIFTGFAKFTISGNHVTLRDFIFQGVGSSVVSITGSNNHLIGNQFISSGKPGKNSSDWNPIVFVGPPGNDNEIAYNLFDKSIGKSLQMKGATTASPGPTNNRIHHNTFQNIRFYNDGNGGETMQLGTGGNGYTTNTRVENNLFRNIYTDPEIISTKIINTKILGNTLINVGGEITVRHGDSNETVVDGNVLIRTRYGVRVNGSNRKVINNFVYMPTRAAFALQDPDDSPLYRGVYNTVFANNTVVASTSMVEFLKGNTAIGAPSGTNTFVNNIFVIANSATTKLVSAPYDPAVYGNIFKNNVFWSMTGTISFPSFISASGENANISADPRLDLSEQTLPVLLTGSPAINAGLLGYALQDIRSVLRDSMPDIGAYEYTDTISPTVAFTAPVANASISGTTTLSVTASDNVGVAGVQFQVDGNTVGGEVTSLPYSISWNSALVTDGPHTITAVARDAAQNTGSATISITVSNIVTPPPPPPPSPDTYKTLKTISPPSINGDPTEINKAPAIVIKLQNGVVGHYRILHDDTNIYIGGTISDQSLNAVTTVTDGDLYRDDTTEIMFDTLNNKGTGLQPDDYKFMLNVLGTIEDKKGTDDTWNGIWAYKVLPHGTVNNNSDTDSSYTFEAAIPWTTLGVPPGTSMGFDIALDDRNASGTRTVATWVNKSGSINKPDKWGTITFGSDLYTSNKFKVGDRVRVVSGSVSVLPGATGAAIGYQQVGALGTVVGGPLLGSTKFMWQIDYDAGADGWSRESQLTRDTTVSSSFRDELVATVIAFLKGIYTAGR